jgi:peptidoglycan hydrolase CwlO-like protein
MNILSAEECNFRFDKINSDLNRLNEDLSKLRSDIDSKISTSQSWFNHEELLKLINKQEHEIKELHTDIKYLAMAVGILLLGTLISVVV